MTRRERSEIEYVLPSFDSLPHDCHSWIWSSTLVSYASARASSPGVVCSLPRLVSRESGLELAALIWRAGGLI